MTDRVHTEVNCPTCGEVVSWTDAFPYRPFCSKRCSLVDLGAWFEEERAIPDDSPRPPRSSP